MAAAAAPTASGPKAAPAAPPSKPAEKAEAPREFPRPAPEPAAVAEGAPATPTAARGPAEPAATGALSPPDIGRDARPAVMPTPGAMPAAEPGAANLALNGAAAPAVPTQQPAPPAPPQDNGSWLEQGWNTLSGAASATIQAVGDFDRENGRVLTRGVGVLQAVGGIGEAVVGTGIALGGGAASLTGVGALPGIPAMIGGGALALNGLDNAQAGIRTAISGEFQHTLAAEATGGIAQALGATPEQAETVRNVTELASGALSIGGGIAAASRIAGRVVAAREAAEAGSEQAARLARTPEQLDQLAKDPAHGGAISPSSIQERTVGLDLEQRGLVPGPITRDPSGSAEFIDAAGTAWDVKGFVSEAPARGGGTRNVFNLQDATANIQRSLAVNENVMLDLSRLNPADTQALLGEVARQGWTGRVIH